MDPLGAAEAFLFEDFRLDRRGLFRRDEAGAFVPVRIGSRALDLLQVLIDRAGELVGKDDIIAAVWPGRVVEDGNLTMQVSILRQILDLGAMEGSCIQTVAGRGYRFVASVIRATAEMPSSTGAASESGARPIPRLSIVVVPFTNLGDDPGQQFFADAITDDVTIDLSRLAGTFVVSRSTAFTYRGKAVDVRQVARDLSVRYVLEGSVRLLGDRVQVNVHLIDGETGSHVWADRFVTDCCDPAEAQKEIVGRLASALNAELLRDTGHRIDQEHAADSDMGDLVLRARALRVQTLSAEVHPRRAMVALLERAISLDPACVDARIEIAAILMGDIADAYSTSVEQDKARTEQLISEVLEREPNHSEARRIVGQLRRTQGRWAESQVELERAIELDPNNTAAIRQLGITLRSQGKPEAAIPYFEWAIRFEVRHRYLFNGYCNLGNCHLYLGRADEAVECYRRARALAPSIFYVHLTLAAALALRGDIDEAKCEIAEAVKLKPEVNSIARWRAIQVTQGFNHPRLQAMRDKTTFTGLRRAGFPEE